MSRVINLVWMLALAGLLPACSTAPKVHVQPKAGADYTLYHTFALLPLPASAPANDPGLILRIAEPARQEAREALLAKGFTEVERTQADITVNLRGYSLPKVEVTDWGYSRTAYTRYGRPLPVHVGQLDVRTTEERTLTLEVFDNRSRELVWVGWSRRTASGPVKVETLQEAIRAILAQFPPSP